MKPHELVKIKLKMLKLTQEDLSQKLNTEQPTISRALNGQSETKLNQIIYFLVENHDCKLSDFYIEENKLIEIDKKLDKVIMMLEKITLSN